MSGSLHRRAAIALMSFALASTFVSAGLAADAKPHRIAIQVDQNDPQVMNLALDNANNVIEYYKAKNEQVDIDIVAYGPGLHMLRADTSPVQDRIKRLKDMALRGQDPVSRPATIPSRAWRRRRAIRYRWFPKPPSSPRASFI